MTITYVDTSAAEQDTSQKTPQADAPGPEELPRQRAAKLGTGYRKQIGTTLEEAFLLSAKGKW
jgi:hypothetical protein